MVKARLAFFLLLVSLPSLGAIPDAEAAENFWLFGFSGHDLDIRGRNRLADLRLAWSDSYLARYPLPKMMQNVRGGFCLWFRNERYRLEWNDSETEGFLYKVEIHPDKKQSCSESSQDWPTFTLDNSELFPLTNLGDGVRFGVTTKEQVQKAMRAKGTQAPDRLRYTIRSDRKKTLDCGPGTGPHDIVIEFRFAKGLLTAILMLDEIAGEC